ncbi:hypothetical protein KHC28_15625 [Ancylobacter sonchi]|uniref:hypothetical protein n=1 Tax=Ancylobacter sonchi TaxID=1937790 RepID=UPI001BD4EC2A|nr:hypothetical protein [Ancylobacter sonchi]MBS7535083.1 hypothetical protein [Ancylobacter sonchi]
MTRYTPILDNWLAELDRGHISGAIFDAMPVEDHGWKPAPPRMTTGRQPRPPAHRAGPTELPAGPATLVPALPPPAEPQPPAPPAQDQAAQDQAPPTPAVPLLARTDFQCAWIVGGGADGFVLCCGAPVMRHGQSWCEPHARRVIRPASWNAYARAGQPESADRRAADIRPTPFRA